MNVICVACLIVGLGSLAWAATFGFAALLRSVDPPQQPDGSPRPPTGGAARCRRRVAPSDPSLSATLSPGWRLQ